MTSGSARSQAVAHCTVVGASHVRRGLGCQDASAGFARGDAAGVVVSDGHGSAPRGAEGAALAVQVATAQLQAFAQVFATDAWTRPGELLRRAREALPRSITKEWTREVCLRGAAPSEFGAFGCTLAFALALGDHVLVGRLGDGDVLVVDSDSQVTEPLALDEACFADQTTSLCLDEAWATMGLRLVPRPVPDGLVVVTTDGYANSYPTQAEFHAAGAGYLALLREHGVAGLQPHLARFLDQVTTTGCGDDVSLALLFVTSRRTP